MSTNKTRTKDDHKDTSEPYFMMLIVYPLYNSYQNRSVNKSKKELAINPKRTKDFFCEFLKSLRS